MCVDSLIAARRYTHVQQCTRMHTHLRTSGHIYTRTGVYIHRHAESLSFNSGLHYSFHHLFVLLRAPPTPYSLALSRAHTCSTFFARPVSAHILNIYDCPSSEQHKTVRSPQVSHRWQLPGRLWTLQYFLPHPSCTPSRLLDVGRWYRGHGCSPSSPRSRLVARSHQHHYQQHQLYDRGMDLRARR